MKAKPFILNPCTPFANVLKFVTILTKNGQTFGDMGHKEDEEIKVRRVI
jgi:hypothetical protein